MLSKIIGFSSINDIIYLNLNISKYNFNQENNQIFELFENIFMPLDYTIEKYKNDNEDNIKITKINNSSYIVLFNNHCEI